MRLTDDHAPESLSDFAFLFISYHVKCLPHYHLQEFQAFLNGSILVQMFVLKWLYTVKVLNM